jgi:hypothetical protein
MKKLKRFNEEFEVHDWSNWNKKQNDRLGIESENTKIPSKTIWLVISGGTFDKSNMVKPKPDYAFEELENAKAWVNYLESEGFTSKEGDATGIDPESFYQIIEIELMDERSKGILNFVYNKPEEKSNSKDLTIENVSPKEIDSLLEKDIRPILLCYTNILPEKFKGVGPGKMNEKTIQEALMKLQRECKYGDVMRAKEAVGTWVRFIYTMKSSSEGLNNWNNWLKTSNGKKYGKIVQEFEKKIYRLAPEKYPKGYNF